MAKKRRVLFLCVGNSCRSQMAEGLLRHAASELFDVESAGSDPQGLSSRAVAVMAELGVDISAHRSKSVEVFQNDRFDYVVTVCDDAADSGCPVFFGQAEHTLHIPFDDPARAAGTDDEIMYTFRRVRDEINEWVMDFVLHEARSNPKNG